MPDWIWGIVLAVVAAVTGLFVRKKKPAPKEVDTEDARQAFDEARAANQVAQNAVEEGKQELEDVGEESMDDLLKRLRR